MNSKHDVFISYKAEDYGEALWVKTELENVGIKCWLAPGSIPGGSSYADEIESAIGECKALVLILTEKVQESKWVKKELDMALNMEKTILPFMIENCSLKNAFNFYLTDVQRYEAYTDKRAALNTMLNRIRGLSGQSAQSAPVSVCPHCGAELQDNAQFCLHCMKNLGEKKNVTSDGVKKRKGRKKWLIISIIAAVVAVFILGNALLNGFANSSSDVITTFEDFSVRAIYLTGKNGLGDLWDPNSLENTHSYVDSLGYKWLMYTADVKIEGADLKIYFCEDGIEVLVALTGITDATYQDAVKLTDCLNSSIYNYTFTNYTDTLTDRKKYPLSLVADGVSVAQFRELKDPTATEKDPNTKSTVERLKIELDDRGTGSKKTDYLVFDLRTRVYGGIDTYDIFLLSTQE